MTEVAHRLGYSAEINWNIEGVGQIDVFLERDGKKMAVEISITTGAEWDFAKIERCLRAKLTPVFVVGNDACRIERLGKRAEARFSSEEFAELTFCTKEKLAALLAATPSASTGKKKIFGYEVTTIKGSGKSATGNTDDVVSAAVGKALSRLQQKK